IQKAAARLQTGVSGGTHVTPVLKDLVVISVTVQPLNPLQSWNVTLQPMDVSKDILNCNWYRAPSTDASKLIFNFIRHGPPDLNTGQAYTGREFIYYNCSMLITNLLSNDSGNYTVILNGPRITRTGHTYFKVQT
uniref:Immunoglobulin V-set domain-containing protein n=1 Tax=Salvator merianae TaxID=96440 RepID=A0A8D0BN54_SALMN